MAYTRNASLLDSLSQSGRLLRLSFPNNDGPDSTLVVNTLYAQEELSRGYRVDVELLSDDVSIPLKAMVGKMMTVSLVRDDGSERHFNGYITEFRYMKTDGGFVFYYAVLEPWLAYAKLRRDCHSFLNCTVLEMTEQTFAHYREHDWKIRMRGEDPKITCMNQYNETDFNHLHRRWEFAGLYYWYEHRIDGHTLWLSDDSTLAPVIDTCNLREAVPGAIPYWASGGSAEGDGIRQWQAVRRVGSGSTSLGTFDYKNPGPQTVTSESMNAQGSVPPQELYDSTGAYGFRDWIDGEPLARRRMEEADRTTQTFEAAGNDRRAMPGRTFQLDGHPSGTMKWPVRNIVFHEPIARREYLITSVRHWAGNNYHAAEREASYYRNELGCLCKTIPWRPGRNFNSEAPPAPGVQTAIVTGPPGEEVYTDKLGRIRLQFHWDRAGKRNEHSSPWIRVAMPMAGRHAGQIGLPRVGQEVVVQFLDQNPDRPLVTGVVYNADHAAPWNLAAQRALTGLRSREFGSMRANQLVLDNTKGEIGAQLRSDHLHSQLALGRIHRLDGYDGHQEARGEGFELRTDGHGVLRAVRGMLVTSEASGGPVKDAAAAASRLSGASEIQSQLAKVAQHYHAQEAGQQDDAGSEAAAQGSEVRGNGGDFPELSAPHVVLASAAGVGITSAGSNHIASEKHTAITAGKSVSIASPGGLFASVGHTLRLFVHKAGMKLVAAAGKVTVQAGSDDVDVIANKVLSLLSETDWIELKGKKGVRLHGANNVLEIGEKVQFFTGTPVLFNGNLQTLASKSASQSFNERPKDCRFDQEVNFVGVDGKPASEIAYEILREDGASIAGQSTSSGSTGVQKGTGMDGYKVRWKGELP